MSLTPTPIPPSSATSTMTTTMPAPTGAIPLEPAPGELTGLRAHAARWRRRQNRLAIALVVVMTLGALAVYLPLRNTLAQTQENIRVTQIELQENRNRAAALPQLRATVASLERQVEHYKPLRPLAADFGAAMTDLGDIKERARPDKYHMDGGQAEIHRATCIERPLKMDFEADFVDALSYVSQVESMDRLTRVRNLTIDRVGDGLNGKGGRVKVSMSLSLYFIDPTATADANGSGGTR